jgi:hypothetical protein
MVRRKGVVAAVVAIALAAVVTVAVALTTTPGPRPPALPSSGILARASVEPSTALFGDPLVATIEALVDSRSIDASTVALHGSFAPYTAATRATERRHLGRVTRLTYTLRLRCLATRCLPPDPRRGGRETFVLPSVRLTFERINHTQGSLVLALGPVEVGSRLTPNEASLLDGFAAAPFRASAGLGSPTYAVSPSLLVALLLAAAALLIAAAAWLILRFGRRPPAPVPLPQPVVLSPLERALVAAERARARGVVPDEREALEHLASELGRTGADELAVTARGLAWSEAGPTSPATLALADDVRTIIEQGRDGHGE